MRVAPALAPRVDTLGSFRPQLLRFAVRRLGNREHAEDAVQETLLAALEGLERFGGDSSLGTWLFAILKHKIVDALRLGSREEPLDGDGDLMHDASPESELARRGVLEAVDAALTRLPARAARVFVLRGVLGMDTDEVCRELSISSANCWVMHHRVRQKLRACPEVRDAIRSSDPEPEQVRKMPRHAPD
ncbi:MAG TPA: sigma-70 family RNA polymerase sigma factor [Burkholderiales bacterium]|nr:sigma-70 family RNA polymerase sigma factor [Burkholderiales bacterium]